MIELFEQDIKNIDRQSSKGNQLKWKLHNNWYKADFTGYEGLAEYTVSHLLELSTLNKTEFITYDLEEIRYKRNIYNGAYSKDFLTDDWQIITLERLFHNKYNTSLYTALWNISDTSERFSFLSKQIKNITGLKDFGIYLNKIFTLDAFFLNEDRHFHNIAVLMNSKGEFDYCPIFDNGACLLSDTTMDYPLKANVFEMIKESHSKTISPDFDEQLYVSENSAGINLHFTFTKKDVEQIVDNADYYDSQIKNRVKEILFHQIDKYSYLFP
jgi:hypothetical protein